MGKRVCFHLVQFCFFSSVFFLDTMNFLVLQKNKYQMIILAMKWIPLTMTWILQFLGGYHEFSSVTEEHVSNDSTDNEMDTIDNDMEATEDMKDKLEDLKAEMIFNKVIMQSITGLPGL